MKSGYAEGDSSVPSNPVDRRVVGGQVVVNHAAHLVHRQVHRVGAQGTGADLPVLDREILADEGEGE